MYNRIQEKKRLLISLSTEYRYLLFISLVLAIFSHGMVAFNKFTFHDESLHLLSVGATYQSGRWGLAILSKIITVFWGYPTSIPIINFGLSILFISFSGLIIKRLFCIKKKPLIIFLYGILICSPVISSLFLYLFTAPYYLFGLMLSVSACYLVCRIKKWYVFIIATILQAFSVGVYQAFIPLVISLILFYYITEIYAISPMKGCFFTILKKALYYLAFIASFIILYFIITKATLVLLNVQLTDYNNIGNMGQESLVSYLLRVLDTYTTIFFPELFYKTGFLPPMFSLLIYYVFILFCLSLALIFIFKAFKKSLCQGLFISFVVILLPLAINFILVMANKDDVHTLMMYSSNALFLFPIILLNNFNLSIKKNSFYSLILCVLLLYVSTSNIYYDNQIYLKAQLIQDRLLSNYTTLVTRIKSTNGYTEEMPVSFIDVENFSDKTLRDTDGIIINSVPLSTTSNLFLEEYNYQGQISVLTGFTPVYKDSSLFKDNVIVQSMPSYPNDGSIQIIDDTIVVKF